MLASMVIASVFLLSACGDELSEEEAKALAGSGSSGAVLLAGDRNGDIHVVDPSDASSTALPSLTYSDSAVGKISSMVFNPTTGLLFAGHGGASGCPGCIYAIDANGFTATFLADNTVVDGTYTAAAGMAVRSDGTIFVEYEGGENLATLDSSTGVATPVGGFFDFAFSGCCGYGMVFSGSTLYLGNDVGLYTINQATAQGTLVANWSYPSVADFQAIDGAFPISPKIASMAVHPDTGVVYGTLNDGSGGSQFRYLVTVNPANAEVTLVGEINSQLDGLVFIF